VNFLSKCLMPEICGGHLLLFQDFLYSSRSVSFAVLFQFLYLICFLFCFFLNLLFFFYLIAHFIGVLPQSLGVSLRSDLSRRAEVMFSELGLPLPSPPPPPGGVTLYELAHRFPPLPLGRCSSTPDFAVHLCHE
jgi:hypothetical protein